MGVRVSRTEWILSTFTTKKLIITERLAVLITLTANHCAMHTSNHRIVHVQFISQLHYKINLDLYASLIFCYQTQKEK
jgi:hypothetical protein